MRMLAIFAGAAMLAASCNIAARRAERQQAAFFEYGAQNPGTLDSVCSAIFPNRITGRDTVLDTSNLTKYRQQVKSLQSWVDSLLEHQDTTILPGNTVPCPALSPSRALALADTVAATVQGNYIPGFAITDTTVDSAAVKAALVKLAASQAQNGTLSAQVTVLSSEKTALIEWLVGVGIAAVVLLVVLIYKFFV